MNIRILCHAAIWHWLHLPLEDVRYMKRGCPAFGQNHNQPASAVKYKGVEKT